MLTKHPLAVSRIARLTVLLLTACAASVAWARNGSWSSYGTPCGTVWTWCGNPISVAIVPPTLSVEGTLDSSSTTTLRASGNFMLTHNHWIFWIVGTSTTAQDPLLLPNTLGCPMLVSGQVLFVGGHVPNPPFCEYTATIPPLGPGLLGAVTANVQLYYWSIFKYIPAAAATNAVSITIAP